MAGFGALRRSPRIASDRYRNKFARVLHRISWEHLERSCRMPTIGFITGRKHRGEGRKGVEYENLRSYSRASRPLCVDSPYPRQGPQRTAKSRPAEVCCATCCRQISTHHAAADLEQQCSFEYITKDTTLAVSSGTSKQRQCRRSVTAGHLAYQFLDGTDFTVLSYVNVRPT